MDVNIVRGKDYRNMPRSRGWKNKANHRPAPGSTKHEYRNPKHGKLKKQSQFPDSSAWRKYCAMTGLWKYALISWQKNKANSLGLARKHEARISRFETGEVEKTKPIRSFDRREASVRQSAYLWRKSLTSLARSHYISTT